jgi:hypothetical protein
MAYQGKSSTHGVDPVTLWGFNQQQWLVFSGDTMGISGYIIEILSYL